MKPAEKLAKKLQRGYVWMIHETETDPDGDPNILQVKSDAVEAYKATGYRLMTAAETKPAAKPEGVKAAGKPAETKPAAKPEEGEDHDETANQPAEKRRFGKPN